MAARTWFFFIAALAIMESLNGSPIEKNGTRLDSGKFTIEGNYVRTYHPDREVEKVLGDITKITKELVEPKGKACKLDFEDGVSGWKTWGKAFKNQPTYGDNPTARNGGHSVNHQGEWWIGTYENRPSKSAPAGLKQGNRAHGTIVSPPFTITGRYISFLIGGSCDMKRIRAELVVGALLARNTTGNCKETMTRKYWDVADFIGRTVKLRLVDLSTWGHLMFDDLKGDMSCDEQRKKKAK